MISRRDFIQLAAATAAILPAGWTPGAGPAAADASRTAALRAARQCHAGARRRPACAASPDLFPRALDQSRHRRREGPGAAPHRQGAARSLQDPGRLGGGLCADLSRISAALAKSLRPARRARPHRHHPESRSAPNAASAPSSSTAAIPGRTATRRLQTKGQDMVDCMALLKPDAMTGHWEFTLGTERVKEIVEQARIFRSSRRMCATPNGTSRLQAVDHDRARRRQDRRDRPGLPLYADRQSALDDPELVVRHPRGRSARPMSKRRARTARNSWCCCRITASTSTASSPRASPAST